MPSKGKTKISVPSNTYPAKYLSGSRSDYGNWHHLFVCPCFAFHIAGPDSNPTADPHIVVRSYSILNMTSHAKPNLVSLRVQFGAHRACSFARTTS